MQLPEIMSCKPKWNAKYDQVSLQQDEDLGENDGQTHAQAAMIRPWVYVALGATLVLLFGVAVCMFKVLRLDRFVIVRSSLARNCGHWYRNKHRKFALLRAAR
tara:strand:- start:278 stop:586 length:309 start_codon:yes stop_codon:yes gene_type:complete